ncbi:hypothetical protein XENTR_v10009393 [Xenopus tropicalis]|nr:TIMELESS-interacting protein [Xenopus tropicalis]XP_004912730.1 TIMELESS-interacting protein [Xenopus tropicalis]XP_031755116.1 TIMELESS-interacting protein [Xenopus tropicalis]KAE8618475.1 hypothetical protein XENTR_v10009393 [Xenopus tropicalis]KAE8618476.1 hypothetical protein XENTR_v10009393 [Xenopus tropicalis]|eukprot:XP_002938396.1 PREDICTED: TIMELESS-interacting protein [Xenopus tropicalis]
MMDPIENGLFDLPDYEDTEDENFPPLPPPHSPGAGDDEAEDVANGDDWTENAGQTQREEAPKPARRVVKRPQPKLDGQRLASKRGLPALRHLFEGVKFKGKGHEAEDVKLLLRQMENWAHRLFPKLQFEDFLNRLESMGNKKEVQTCLKKIRMDLPIVHEDFLSEEVVVQTEDHDTDMPSEDFSFPEELHVPSQSQPVKVDLSEETLQRIERNRRLALERRMEKMQAQAESQALSQTTLGKSDPDEIPDDFDAEMLDATESMVLAPTEQQSPHPVDTDLSLGLNSQDLPVQEVKQSPAPCPEPLGDGLSEQALSLGDSDLPSTSDPSSPRMPLTEQLPSSSGPDPNSSPSATPQSEASAYANTNDEEH